MRRTFVWWSCLAGLSLLLLGSRADIDYRLS